MNLKQILMVSICSLTSFCAQAAVYKWVDENGRTHFSDKPPESLQQEKAGSPIQNIFQKTTSISKRKKGLAEKRSISNSVKLKLRRLFEKNEFEAINNQLRAMQLQVESDISTEVKAPVCAGRIHCW